MSQPIISIIAAVGTQSQLGLNGNIPWKSPEDLKRFKYLTMGKPVIMGRKTYESIGSPLPGRQNIVLTSQTDYCAPMCNTTHNFSEAIAALSQNRFNTEVFIIGGESVYKEAMPHANMLYLTHVPYNGPADTYFPKIQGSWSRVYNEKDKDGNMFEILWRK